MLAYGPVIATLLPVWLLGVGAYRITAKCQIGPVLGAVLCLAPLIAWAAYEVWTWHGGVLLPGAASFFSQALALQDYLLGTLFACHIIGFSVIASGVAEPLRRIERPVRWIAGATFSVYLFHMPIAQFIASVMPWPTTSAAGRLAVYGGTIVAVFLLAEVTERRKTAWKQAIAGRFVRHQWAQSAL